MKYTSAISALLLAEAALGARLTEKRRESRAARQLSTRSGGTRKSQPKIVNSNISNVEYSSNWAGAVIDTTKVTEVTGTVVVPTLTTSSSGNTESAGSAVSSLYPHWALKLGLGLLMWAHSGLASTATLIAQMLSCRPALTGMSRVRP